MKKSIFTFILTSSFIFSQDAIQVSPSSLDFGNVLMGNTPTMTFTLTCNLDQTITISPPSFYTVDITEIAMTSGQTQDIVVTFDPPQIGNYDSQIVLAGATFGNAVISVTATAVNNLEGSLSGMISAEFSPYEISGDIFVETGNTLTIDPGVELQFSGDYGFTINGDLIAEGKPDSLITFTSSASNEFWGGISIDNSDNSAISYSFIRNVGNVYDFYDDYTNLSNWDEGSLVYSDYVSSPSCMKLAPSSTTLNSNLSVPLIVTTDNIKFNFIFKQWSSYSHTSSNYRGILYLEYLRNESSETWQQLGNFSAPAQSESDYTSDWIPVTLYKNVDNMPDIEIGDTLILRLSVNVHQNYATTFYIDDFDYLSDDQSSPIKISNCNTPITNTSISDSKSMQGVNLMEANIYNIYGSGIRASNSYPQIINSILWGNGLSKNTGKQIDIISGNPTISHTLIQNYNASNIGISGQYSDGGDNLDENPAFSDEMFHLGIFSPCIDAGHPNDYDACIPPGLGTLTADMGMYGGMNNCGTEETNIGGGEPTITTIEDLPQDQGGFVGLQFEGSFYDGGSNIYDITHYSIWRELNTEGRNDIDFNGSPFGQYFRSNSRDDEAWEYIGESPAQQFGVYGYTSPTLADSNYIGQFSSKYLVVAHTPDDDIFFVSVPDSGYSVDNLAPDDPENLRVETFVYENTVEWDLPTEEDFWQTEIKRNGEIVALGSNFNEYIETNINPGQLSHYEITHIDQNGNRSESTSRDVQSPEWIFRFETQSQTASNSNFYFAANDSASFGYDPMYDLMSAPLPPGDHVQLSVSRPEWDTGLSDDFSYISVGNVDLEYFNREIVIDAHSTVNETVTVRVYPEGNYDVGMFGISINNNPISYIDYGDSFEIPVSDSSVTTIRVVAGNPDGSGGNISFVSPNEISVLGADPMNVVIAKTPIVNTIDISYTTDGNNFIVLDTSIVMEQVMDTIMIDWRSIMTNEGIQHLPNLQYKVTGFGLNGGVIGENLSSQFTIIDDQFTLSLPTPDWRLVHPYYTDENMNNLLNASLDGNYTAYWWNGESQAYEIINNSDYMTQKARSVWVMNMIQNEVLMLSGNLPDEADYNYLSTNIDQFPGWAMLGSSARPVSKDSIIVRLLHGNDPYVFYTWAEAVENGVVQDAIFSCLPGNNEYEMIDQLNMTDGFWIGITHDDTTTAHSIEFNFPAHYLDMGGNRNARNEPFDWGITLNQLAIGFSENASNDQDEFDLVAPPSSPTNAPQMRISHSDWGSPLGSLYMSDIRHDLGDTELSAYDLELNNSGSYSINIETFSIPDSFGIVLQYGQEQFNLMELENLELNIGDDFDAILYVGRTDLLSNDLDGITPKQYSLYQNYPNPFNPITIISYDLP